MFDRLRHRTNELDFVETSNVKTSVIFEMIGRVCVCVFDGKQGQLRRLNTRFGYRTHIKVLLVF